MKQVQPTDEVKAEKYVTPSGLGVSKFYLSGKLIHDETKGIEVKPQFATVTGRAISFGALRAKFNLIQPKGDAKC